MDEIPNEQENKLNQKLHGMWIDLLSTKEIQSSIMEMLMNVAYQHVNCLSMYQRENGEQAGKQLLKFAECLEHSKN